MTSSSPRGAARRKAGTAPAPPERNGGKPAGATTARRELVENEIYEHAIRLFAERGFAGTSLQDIADALGITRPALYYYVKSKDELLAKLAADVAGGSAAQIAELAARPDLDAAGKLREIARLTCRPAGDPARAVPPGHPLRGGTPGGTLGRLRRQPPGRPGDRHRCHRGGDTRGPVPARRRPGRRAGRDRHVQLGRLVVPARPRQCRRRRRPAGRHGHRGSAAGRATAPPAARGQLRH